MKIHRLPIDISKTTGPPVQFKPYTIKIPSICHELLGKSGMKNRFTKIESIGRGDVWYLGKGPPPEGSLPPPLIFQSNSLLSVVTCLRRILRTYRSTMAKLKPKGI